MQMVSPEFPDDLEPCNCYYAGADLSSLACKGCAYCSRAQRTWGKLENDVDDVLPLAVRSIQHQLKDDISIHESNWIKSWSLEDIKKEQEDDPELKTLIHWLNTGEPPSEHELQLESPATKHWWNCRTQLELVKGCLFYKWLDPVEPRTLLLLPKSLKEDAMKYCHICKTAGHFGQAKTQKLQQRFICNQMGVDAILETMQPVDLLLGTAESNMEINRPCQYIKDLKNALEKAQKTARYNLKAAQLIQKRDYDVTFNHRIYNKGNRFRYKNKKLRAPWQGPYLIEEVLSSVLYKMRTRKRELTIHHDQLKPCSDRNIPKWLKYTRNRLLQGEVDYSLGICQSEEENIHDLSQLFREDNDREPDHFVHQET
ncbi:unnamed protein product [Mytilus coruscus]|uniref:Integrase p58-like C-terminal domain-containing protein n=1 Tax=Mytilus coruscus TaxID=42192 RepID=A0A6J8BSP3_MYTCO|nr:unnamed protein product [Mytilus coruscus]